MLNDTFYRPWLHAVAWVTVLLTLLPISVGAMVTTIDAGMAFADWPTSNGVGMLEYPLHKAGRDEFWEHSHRLAGMLVGFVTLILTGLVLAQERRGWVQAVGGLVLLGVVGQGLLGGWRVLADERLLAMLHGTLAALVFAVMGTLVMVTGKKWLREQPLLSPGQGTGLLVLAVVTVLTLFAQYLLGGLLRHLFLPFAWLVHPWFAIAVLVCGLVLVVLTQRSGNVYLSRWAVLLLTLMLVQTALGLLTWRYHFGFPEWGIVGLRETSFDSASRSVHKVVGSLTFMASVLMVVRVLRVRSRGSEFVARTTTSTTGPLAGAAS